MKVTINLEFPKGTKKEHVELYLQDALTTDVLADEAEYLFDDKDDVIIYIADMLRMKKEIVYHDS